MPQRPSYKFLRRVPTSRSWWEGAEPFVRALDVGQATPFKMRTYDAIVVGLGIAGSSLAYTLASKGKVGGLLARSPCLTGGTARPGCGARPDRARQGQPLGCR